MSPAAGRPGIAFSIHASPGSEVYLVGTFNDWTMWSYTGSYTGNNNGGANPFQTIERQEVGIMLRVRPQVNEGSAVRMEIEQESSDLLPQAQSEFQTSDVVTAKRTITTNVMVGNNEVLVLGGPNAEYGACPLGHPRRDTSGNAARRFDEPGPGPDRAVSPLPPSRPTRQPGRCAGDGAALGAGFVAFGEGWEALGEDVLLGRLHDARRRQRDRARVVGGVPERALEERAEDDADARGGGADADRGEPGADNFGGFETDHDVTPLVKSREGQ